MKYIKEISRLLSNTMSFLKLTEEEIKQQGIIRKSSLDLGEGSQLNADSMLSMLSRSLPSPSGTFSTASLKKRSSVSSFIEKGFERGRGAFDVAYGIKEAVDLDSLHACERRINVLSEVIKKIAGKNKKVENLLKNGESVVEDFLKAFQKPSQSEGEDIKAYEEIIEKIIQLEKLENEIREKKSQVETLKNRLGLINQRREEEEEDRKELENEIVDLEENLRKVKQEYEEIVRELEGELKMLEEMEEVYNGIIGDLEENERELQKDLKLKTSEINTLDRRLGSKIDDKERLTVTILDTVDACALSYKEKMLYWLESDLKKAGDNLVNKFNCLKQLLEPNRETKTGQRWRNLFNSFDAYYENLENFLSEERQEKENQIESRLKELKEQENDLLNKKSQLEQEVETLQQQIRDLRKEKDILLKSLASVKLEELVKKIDFLQKELVGKTEEKRSIEERLNKIKEEQKEVIDKKKDLSNEHQRNQEERNKRREKRWNKRLSGPEMVKKYKEKEKEETREIRTTSRQITDNNLKGKKLQKEHVDLEERLIKTYRENEENYQQNISELKTELEEKKNLVGLCSQLYSLEKQLNSAKLKISERRLKGLLDVYKEEASKKAKEELNKELSEDELEAIIHEDDVRRKIEEIKRQLQGKIDLPPNTD